MGIFTGVQFITIVCTIARTKCAALLIGPAGVGLFGLYNSAMDVLKSISELGLRSSTIPSIASSKTLTAIARICFIVRRWNWALGIAGAILTIILSPVLSRLTFGDSDHTFGFILLSASVIFSAIAASELAILQGLGKIKRMAKASVIGAIGGLAVSVPLFYWFGIDSIVPVILAYSSIIAIASWLMRENTPTPQPEPTTAETFREGIEFVRLGFFMALSSAIALLASYVIKAWLNNYAGTGTVGIFDAGFMLSNRYLGLVFSAIAVEYYPRLCKVRESGMRISAFVSHEMLITVAVLLPMALLFMAFDDIVIYLLYDSEFIASASFINLALAGTALRAISWCMSFVILARGDGRIFIITEGLDSVLSVALFIGGYSIGGFVGLGAAYIIWYGLYTLIIATVYFRVYRLRVNRNVLIGSLCATLLLLACGILRVAGYRIVVIAAGVMALAASGIMFRRMFR